MNYTVKIIFVVFGGIIAFIIIMAILMIRSCEVGHFKITGNELSLVEVNGPDYYYDTIQYTSPRKETHINSTYCYTLSKENHFVPGKKYGLLISDELDYYAAAGGNTAFASPMAGVAGSEQKITSFRLFLLNGDGTDRDLSELLQPADTVSHFVWKNDRNYDRYHLLGRTATIPAFQDSFNLSWSKRPMRAKEFLYIFPPQLIQELPADFTLKLEVKFKDGAIQESTVEGRK